MSAAWQRQPLGAVLDVASGQVDPKKPPYSGMHHIGGENIESGTGRLLDVSTAADLGLTSGKYLFGSTDVLYSKIRPRLNKVVAPNFEGICSADIYPLRPRPGQIAREFLVHLLRSADFLTYTEKHSSRTNIPKLNREGLLGYEVALPPLNEQRRIAEVLDRAEALRAKRRAALGQLDTLTQSIFLDLFGEPSESRWDMAPISEYVAQFEGGKSLEAEAAEVRTRNRVLKISAVTGMKYRPDESKPVPDSYHPPIEHFVKPGDLLFSRANTSELVGAVAYVDETPANVLLPDKLWRFVWRKPTKVEPLFVWALFQTPALRQEIERRATGTSGSMKNISQEKLYGIRTLLPPLAVQQEFVRRSRAVEKLKSAQRRSLAELDALFASLQHRAFRGEL